MDLDAMMLKNQLNIFQLQRIKVEQKKYFFLQHVLL